jgi:hypothetical protein
MTDQQLAIQNQPNNFAIMPVINVRAAIQRYQDQKDFISSVLHVGVDFGAIPGTSKNTLLKPGAEKLAWFFGLRPVFEDVEKVEDWTGKDHGGEPFFYYREKCTLYKDGQIVASADGSCNSMEKKYRYRWVVAADVPANMDKARLQTKGGRISEFDFALDKSETSGQYGKPAEYWKQFQQAIQDKTATRISKKTKSGKEYPAWEIDSTLYAIPNTEIADLVNTILKMAQKRSLVAVVLIGANASEWFTQDMEDFIDGSFVDADATPVQTPPAQTAKPAQPVQQKKQYEPAGPDIGDGENMPDNFDDPFPPAVSAPVQSADDPNMPDNVAAAIHIKIGKKELGDLSLDELAAIIEDEKKPKTLRDFANLVLSFKTA